MHVLVLNSGSSSIKVSMFSLVANVAWSGVTLVCEGELSGVGTSDPQFEFRDAAGKDLSSGNAVQAASTAEAIRVVAEAVSKYGLPKVDAVGYRVVHPGPKLEGHQRITPEVMEELRNAKAFAPLHDPVAVELIEAMMERLPRAPHFACFDTVFHQTMPEAAKTYAIPMEYRERGVRRYGFHGLSCESILMQLKDAGIAVPERIAIAHLGSGCSVTAAVNGKSIDTTMGLTPTGGVVMGTRPGDLDPGLMIYLLRQTESDEVEELEAMVNHKAGMAGLSGMANDMKAVRKAASDGDPRARLAVDVFTRSIRKAIGGFAFLMGGMDAVICTGGIGEHDAATRMEVLAGLEGLGIRINAARNQANGNGVRAVSEAGSSTTVYVVPAAEDRIIAWHVGQML